MLLDTPRPGTAVASGGHLVRGWQTIANGNWPTVLEVNGKLVASGVVGASGQAGTLYVYEDGTLHTIATTTSVDDHIHPAILMPTDKPPLVAWSRHDEDSTLRYRVGTTNADLTSLAAEQTLAAGAAASYAAIYRRPSTNDLLLICRAGQTQWKLWRSTNYGSSWTGPTTLVDWGASTKCYVFAHQNGSTLNCVTFDHWISGGSNHNAYFFKIDLDTGAITTAGGTSIANLDGTNLPMTPTTLGTAGALAWSPGASENHRSIAVSTSLTNPAIAIAKWTTTTDTQYRYVRWNGSSWDDRLIVAAGVQPFGNPISSLHNHGLVSFPEPFNSETAYVAREASGVWYIERYDTSDGGQNWTVAEITRSRTAALMFPQQPIGWSLGPRVIWRRMSMFDDEDHEVASLAGPG